MDIRLSIQNIQTFNPLAIRPVAAVFLCPSLIGDQTCAQQLLFQLMTCFNQQLCEPFALGELLIGGIAHDNGSDTAFLLHIAFLGQLLDRAADRHFADTELFLQLRLGRDNAAERVYPVQNPVLEDLLDLLV